jgi:hypothetical protein
MCAVCATEVVSMSSSAQSQKNSGPKLHHFVPRMLQKRFLNEKGRLHYVRRSEPDKIIEVGPNQIFGETHLYASIEKEGTKELSLERAYSALESAADPIIEEICAAARPGETIEYAPGVKEFMADFIFNQLRRSPDYHRKIASDETLLNSLETTAANLKIKFPSRTVDINRLLEKEHHRTLFQNVRVGMLKRPSDNVLNVFHQMALCVSCTDKANRSFVLGSIPVVKLGSDALIDKSCEIWMPISSKAAVGFVWGNEHHGRIIELGMADLRRMNLAIVRQSSAFAAASQELVKSLLRAA